MKRKYIGEGDVFDFSNQRSFAGEHITGLEYGIRFTNTSINDQTIAISPALLHGLPVSVVANKTSGIDGYLQGEGVLTNSDGSDDLDGLADDSAGTSGSVTATSLDGENPLDFLLHFAAINPIRMVRLELQSDQKSQFTTKIEQRTLTPFKSANKELSINLRKFVSADQFQDDRTEVKLLKNNSVLTLAYDTVIYFKLRGLSKFEWNIDIGVMYNIAHTLRKRAAIAHANLSATMAGSLQN